MTRLREVASEEIPDTELDAAAKRAAAERAHLQAQHHAATQMLMMGIKALSQKFIVALSRFFTLATAGSAFYMWYLALPTLDTQKIVGLTIYSAFVLALNWRNGREA